MGPRQRRERFDSLLVIDSVDEIRDDPNRDHSGGHDQGHREPNRH
jgi:hypothetical protein